MTTYDLWLDDVPEDAGDYDEDDDRTSAQKHRDFLDAQADHLASQADW